MASLRTHARIRRSADDVWAVVSAAERISEWFPGMVSSSVDGDVRTITLRTGMPLIEQIVNVDHRLRRFQYSVTGPMPMRHHLGTADVIDDTLDPAEPACLLVYSTQIEPDPMAFVFDGAIAEAVANLARLLDDHAIEIHPAAPAEPAAQD
jgi:hypothetical protein